VERDRDLTQTFALAGDGREDADALLSLAP
jgi:hypothetical protein